MEIAIARDALGRPLPGLEQNVHEVKSGDLTANWIAATRRAAGQKNWPQLCLTQLSRAFLFCPT